MLLRDSLFAVLCLIVIMLPTISFAEDGYYVLGKERLEFRIAVDKDKGVKPEGDWEEMVDYQNNRFYVSKKIEFDSSDIEGVLIEKSPWEGGGYEIHVYFKKESWEKIYYTTGRLLDKRLGIVRGNRLMNAPVVYEALGDQAMISGTIGSKQIKWFINGFIPNKKHSQNFKDKREKEYLKFLEDILTKNPGDLDLKQRIAGKYMYGAEEGLRKAATMYEEIMQSDPSKTNILLSLGTCYIMLKEYDKALNRLENALTARPGDEWLVRMQMAEVYRAQGQSQNAISELEKSIEAVKSSTLSNSDSIAKMLESEIKEIKKTLK